MGKRRTARELALKLLFQIDVGKVAMEEVLAQAWEANRYSPDTLEFTRQLVEGTVAQRKTIDSVITKYAQEWSLSRMANVDRNILRLAVYEILYLPDIPPSVSIDEAVELAKKYSTGESGKFVNGILGSVVRHHQPAETSAPAKSSGS